MYTHGRCALHCLAVFVSLLAGCVVAPQQRQPLPPPNTAYEEIRRCRSDNQQAHAEVLNTYEAARRAGRINPGEAGQFNAMEARLRNVQIELARDGLSLQECQRIGGAIARERDEVARMTRSDPAVARCMADNRRAHQEVVGLYENARRSGRINPGEAQRFNAIEGRLGNVRMELARDGLSLQECQRIGGAIARERDEVARMTRSDAAAARCMADNRRAHQEVVGLYENAKRSGRINPSEAQRFNAIDAKLQNLRAELGREGISMQECQRIGGAIARERAEVTRMAQHDPGVARCVADNRRARDELYKVYNNALRAGRIEASEAQRFQAIDKRLNGFQAEIERDGLSLAECQRIGSAIARERALVEKMAR